MYAKFMSLFKIKIILFCNHCINVTYNKNLKAILEGLETRKIIPIQMNDNYSIPSWVTKGCIRALNLHVSEET